MTGRQPERPAIVDAETPESREEWYALIWANVEEFIHVASAGRGGSGNNLHLSPFTFPGGELDEGDEPAPYCGCSKRTRTPRRKDVAVYPPGWIDLCDHCLYCFKQYHETGRPPSRKRDVDGIDGGEEQRRLLENYKNAVKSNGN